MTRKTKFVSIATFCLAAVIAFVLIIRYQTPLENKERKSVAIQKLIADTNNRWNGHRILVRGYLKSEPGDRILFPTKETAKIGLLDDGVYISPSQWSELGDCEDRYVSISGFFGPDEQGILGLAVIESISEIDLATGGTRPCGQVE